MKFGVGITLYNPDKKIFDYINQLKNIFFKIYIYDNTKNNTEYISNIDNSFLYSYTGENRGLSKAFNWFIDKAFDNSIDYLLILDQDSCFAIEKLEKLIDEIEEIGVDDNVAIRACKAQPQNIKHIESSSEIVNSEEKVISSGSFLCMKVIKKHGLRYDENLFVDYVDDDFCKSVRAKGLQIICHNRFILPQQLGYIYKGRICHSAVRHYYRVRDYGYMNQKYYSKRVIALRITIFLIKNIKNACYEDNKLSKLRCSIKGYVDYFKRKTGEYKK